MPLPDGVLELPLTFQLGERDFLIHPAALETDRGLVLVDTGIPGAAAQLQEQLAGHGYDLADVAMVLVTHQDMDHAGSVAEVVERSGAIVLAHREDAPYVDGREVPIKSARAGRERYPAHPVDVELSGGERLRTAAGPADVVFTPGHTPGHVALHLPEAGLLITGDAMVAEDGRLQGFNPGATLDHAEAARSIGLLAELDVATTLCYHGGLTKDGTDRLREIAAELEPKS